MRKRNIAIDVIRIVAVLAVVMIHVSVSFVDENEVGSISFLIGNIFDGISRLGVPLFVMVSGVLMLDEKKQITTQNIMFKNTKNILILIIIWAVLYSFADKIISPLLKGGNIDFKEFLRAIILGHYHMWYLYMIVGLYLATPFIRGFVTVKNKNIILVFIGISLLIQYVPQALKMIPCMMNVSRLLIKFINKFYLNFFTGYITYYLTGWYIVHIGIKKKNTRSVMYIMGILCIVAIIVNVAYTGNYDIAYSNYNLLVFIYSVSVFLFLYTVYSKRANLNQKAMVLFSKLTFGVYIIHPAILAIAKILINFDNTLVCILSQYIVVVLISFSSTYIVSKLPFFKYLVRM